MVVEDDDDRWVSVERWWNAFADETSTVLQPGLASVTDTEQMTGEWRGIDAWWNTVVDGTSTVLQPALVSVTDPEAVTGDWRGVDAWWGGHIASLRDSLRELQVVLEEAEAVWGDSSSRFDSDPLAVDWASGSQLTGPLRTHQEENWSQWLAHLIRAGPAEFSRALFGELFDAVPRSVKREVHLAADDAPNRYADILVFYDERAVSIEVKKGDEHYEKTIHTASLIESQFRDAWKHVLLLPAYKEGALRQSFPDALSEADDGSAIESERSGDIDVMHWLDVGRAIRTVLLSDVEASSQWEASAYLFCTVVEQHLVRFVPKPVIDRCLTASDVVRTTTAERITPRRVDDQIAYLRETTIPRET